MLPLYFRMISSVWPGEYRGGCLAASDANTATRFGLNDHLKAPVDRLQSAGDSLGSKELSMSFLPASVTHPSLGMGLGNDLS